MKKNIIAIVALAAMVFASCDSMLDVEPQGSSVSDEQLQELIKKDADKVLAPMMSGALDYMHTGNRQGGTNDRGFMVWNLGMDLQGNDMALSSTMNWFADEYMFENLRQQTAAYTADKWYIYYKIIYKANQILDLIPADATGSALSYKAQCLTYRALGYYYLMCIYQDNYLNGGKDKAGVPLYLSTYDPVTGRTPSAEVFAQIIKDLQDAVKIFTEIECDPKASVTDIDQTVANMLLARAALTIGENTIAANAADAVIKAGYSLMGEEAYTTSGFLDVSLPETIWGYDWAEATSLGNRAFASWVSLTAIDAANNKGVYICIDDQLYKQIPDTDYRKKNFLAATDGSYPAMATVKFNTPTFYADEVFMRLSEAYLLKAEAEARGGNNAAAQNTLYALVSQRDSAYEKSSKTGAALLEEIYLQSRIELWGEGHEWFTNKRFNKGVDRMASGNHQHKCKVAAGKDFTYQIPLSIEINSNPNINEGDQNPL